jgi:4-hydroxybenzoate polyprenyltransferase
MHVLDRSQSSVLSWLQLVRLPAVFTAIADIGMAYFYADRYMARPLVALGLVTTTVCLYWAGMILNDVFDVAVDMRERPSRPLPAGRIDRRVATSAGLGLLAAGIVVAWLIHGFTRSGGRFWLGPGPIALVLAAVIVLYDWGLKSTVWGPVGMGACRSLHLLMGMSVASDPLALELPAPWLICLAWGIYVMGITWFARHEATTSPRAGLVAGFVLMLTAVGLLMTIPAISRLSLPHTDFSQPWVWPLLLLLVTLPVWRLGWGAIRSCEPNDVQAVIRRALLALIPLDAAHVLWFAGLPWALAVLALLVPANLLGRWIRIT